MSRVNELLRREIGEAIIRLINDRGFDMASVTVTQVEVTRDLREGTVLVSILDHAEQRDRMMAQIRHHRAEIQAYMAKHVRLKYTPRLTFRLDPSIEKGDRLLSLLSQMESDSGGEAPQAAGEGENV
jgi:ribosome-binding factor A